MNIIFFGTPQFSTVLLEALVEAHMPPVVVITAPDKPAGRGQLLTSPSVKKYADAHHIPVLQPKKLKDEQFLKTLQEYKADVFVIAAYGKILPAALLDLPPKGTINVHPSLLPRHRGPSPIQGALLAGDSTTGVTLMLTDTEMDHGPIISSAQFQIPDSHITYMQLHDILASLGGTLLVKTLPKWIAGEIQAQEQDHQKATYTKLLTKEDGHIDWTKSAENIDRMVRALNPWPGTWNYVKTSSEFGSSASATVYSEAELPNKRIKILAGHPTNEPSTTSSGTLVKTKNGRTAVCTKDALYEINTVQMEGKKPASDIPFQLPLMFF